MPGFSPAHGAVLHEEAWSVEEKTEPLILLQNDKTAAPLQYM